MALSFSGLSSPLCFRRPFLFAPHVLALYLDNRARSLRALSALVVAARKVLCNMTHINLSHSPASRNHLPLLIHHSPPSCSQFDPSTDSSCHYTPRCVPSMPSEMSNCINVAIRHRPATPLEIDPVSSFTAHSLSHCRPQPAAGSRP